jgi:tetratricopeptide (TPR) repeat protein
LDKQICFFTHNCFILNFKITPRELIHTAYQIRLNMGIAKKVFVFASLFLLVGSLSAQSTLSKANKQFELKAYNLAVKSYLKILDKQPNNVEALSRLGDCYWYLNQMEESKKYYQQAVETGRAAPIIHMQYGHSLKALGQYEAAAQQYKEFGRTYPVEGKHFEESCDFAQSRANEPTEYNVRAEYLNTTASDFGASFLGDQIVFSSSRLDMKRQETEGKRSSGWMGNAGNQLFVSERDNNDFLMTPDFLRTDIRNEYNEGPIAYSPDGQWVAITKNNFVDGTRQIPSSGLELSIYIAEVTGDGDWENAIPFPYNGSGFSTGYPCWSPDGDALYFASDRPDGFGGFDIFVSYKQRNGWSVPENLGAVVNTVGNEITPYFDGKVLYFSSDWHLGFGGFDIFRGEETAGRWTEVYHMGTGINSPRDDYGYVFDPVKQIGYLTSNRPGGKGLEDIYRVKPNTDNLVIQVLNATDRSPIEGAMVDMTSCGKGVFSTDASGRYTFLSRQGMNCTVQISLPGYSSSSLNITTLGSNQVRNFEVLLRKSGEEYLGMVKNVLTGEMLSDVRVRAINQLDGSSMEATTDARGQYNLALKANTSYLVRYSRAGFVDVSRTVRVGAGTDRSILGAISITPSSALAGSKPVPDAPIRPNAVPKSYSFAQPAMPASTVIQEGFAIQVAAISADRAVSLEPFERKLASAGPVYTHEEGGKVKVRVGPFPTREEAVAAQKSAERAGFKGSFLVKQDPVVQERAPQPDLTPKAGIPSDVPTSYGNSGFLPNTAPAAPAKEEFMIQLASYRDTRYFKEDKVLDLGILEKRPKNDLTVMLLSGYQSKSEAQSALKKAKQRGFTGAYLVKAQGDGDMERVR